MLIMIILEADSPMRVLLKDERKNLNYVYYDNESFFNLRKNSIYSGDNCAHVATNEIVTLSYNNTLLQVIVRS